MCLYFFFINYAATLEVTVLNVQVLYIYPQINKEANYSQETAQAIRSSSWDHIKRFMAYFSSSCDVKREEDCSTCDPGLWFLSVLCLGGRSTQRAGAFLLISLLSSFTRSRWELGSGKQKNFSHYCLCFFLFFSALREKVLARIPRVLVLSLLMDFSGPCFRCM